MLKHLITILVGLLLYCSPVTAAAMEQNTDRPGMDYGNFWLPNPDPRLCEKACGEDKRCAAFTFVKPGIQGPKARCWLKSSVPAARPNDCCISGVKPASMGSSMPAQQQTLKREPRAQAQIAAPRQLPPQTVAKLQRFKQFDATWKQKLSSRITDVNARFQQKMAQMRQRNGSLMRQNLQILQSGQGKQVQLCLTPDGRLEPCPPGYGTNRGSTEPVIESYFADTYGADSGIILGDEVLLIGHNFGEKRGFITLSVNPGTRIKIPVSIIEWSDQYVRIRTPAKVQGVYGPMPAALEIETNGGGINYGRYGKPIGLSPKMVITNISGAKYLKRDDGGEKGSSVEQAAGVLKVSHDPGCGLVGSEGNDWFFKQHSLPGYVTLIDYNIQVIDPNVDPDSFLDAVIQSVKNWGELAWDIWSGNFESAISKAVQIGKGLVTNFARFFDSKAGSYKAVLGKKPNLPGDPSLSVHWENSCTGTYDSLPIEYLATFLVTYPEGYTAP